MILRVLLIVHESDRESVSSACQSSEHSVTIVGMSSTPNDVPMLCSHLRPDAVVLDPGLDDGEFIQGWRSMMGPIPALICVSAEAQYALPAFDAGAVHYVSSVDDNEAMHVAIQRAVARVVRYDRGDGNGATARERSPVFGADRIALSSASGIDVHPTSEIMSAHGEGNYTRVVLRNDPPVIISRTLGDVEPRLCLAGLLRVHRSHMVNLQHIRHVRRGKSPVIQLINGEAIDVSERYRGMLFDMMQVRIHRKQDQA